MILPFEDRPGQGYQLRFIGIRQNIKDDPGEGDRRDPAFRHEREDALRETSVARHVEDRSAVRLSGPKIRNGGVNGVRRPEPVRAGVPASRERVLRVEEPANVPARFPDDLFFRTLVHIRMTPYTSFKGDSHYYTHAASRNLPYQEIHIRSTAFYGIRRRFRHT